MKRPHLVTDAMRLLIFSRKKTSDKRMAVLLLRACKCRSFCDSYMSEVSDGVRLWVEAALFPVGGAWVCLRPEVSRGGSSPASWREPCRFYQTSPQTAQTEKSSPGSEFPGLEPQQLKKLLDSPSFPGRKAHRRWKKGSKGSCRSTVTKRVESLARRD